MNHKNGIQLTNASSTRIRGFDGLRALAFLLVFVSHKYASPFTERYGTAGVWVFFVLSGFLITRVLGLSREKIEAGQGAFWDQLSTFYVRRTARIFPVYYAFLAILTVLAGRRLIDIGEPLRQLSNWLYVTNLYIERHGWRTDLGHLWSLAVEEQYYLLFAPVALIMPRHWLRASCFALIALSLAAHAYLFATGAWAVSFDVNSFVNFGLMAVGGLAGLSADRRLPVRLRGDTPLAMMLCFVFLIPAVFSVPNSWLHFGRATSVMTALLLVQIYQAQNGRLIFWLDIAPLRGLGIISYGAYLFHPVIKSNELLHWGGFTFELQRSFAVAIDLMLTIGLAWISWRVLERPLRRIIQSARQSAGA
jgi:peptidoglycan/LPS O-acetylase OafA/YrhL